MPWIPKRKKKGKNGKLWPKFFAQFTMVEAQCKPPAKLKEGLCSQSI